MTAVPREKPVAPFDPGAHPRPELLAPAGGMAQLTAALRFGADAVYGGLTQFGLRAGAENFTPETLRDGIALTHAQGKRFYVTLNLMPTDADLPAFLQTARVAADAGVDAAIVSDPGAALLLHENLPQLALHVSTQANVLNTPTAQLWHTAMGATRIVLARELSLADIAGMRAQLPATLMLEAFVHGAMCVAYSGRCLLSAALTGRSANRGACAQPCRWQYALMEARRPGEYLPLMEEGDSTALFSAYDLCMLPHLPALLATGIGSLKIEGRMKSPYYVATVTGVYRRALDLLYMQSEQAYRDAVPQLLTELDKASHRPGNTGFYFGKPQPVAGAAACSQTMEFVAQVIRGAEAGMPAEVELKNRFYVGDQLEVLTPEGSFPFTVEDLAFADSGEPTDTYGVAGARLLMRFPFPVAVGDLLRGPNRNHRTPEGA